MDPSSIQTPKQRRFCGLGLSWEAASHEALVHTCARPKWDDDFCLKFRQRARILLSYWRRQELHRIAEGAPSRLKIYGPEDAQDLIHVYIVLWINDEKAAKKFRTRASSLLPRWRAMGIAQLQQGLLSIEQVGFCEVYACER